MDKRSTTIGDLVDLARYPFDRTDTAAYRQLMDDSREALADNMLCCLTGFLTPQGIDTVREDVRGMEAMAELRRFTRTPYVFNPPDDDTPADHPRRREQDYEVSYVYGQRFEADRPLRQVYGWDDLLDFLSQVVGHRLYRSADPTYDLIVTLIGPGGIHGWHFDSNEFVVSLMLEPADEGGVFEYVPNLRGPDDEHYDDVERLLDGERSRVVTVPAEAGSLLLFHGHHSMHRVSRVAGTRTRRMALLSFDHRPAMTFNNPVLRGRTA